MGDFLLGYVSDSLLTNAYVVDQRHWASSFFVQDDWKVTSKLSVNLGLRYDFITPALEAENRQANFDPVTPRHGVATDGSLAERGLVNPDKNNFAPRIGAVYKLNDKTVLRGGYGIFYNMFDRIGSEDQIALNPGTGWSACSRPRPPGQRPAVPAPQRLPRRLPRPRAHRPHRARSSAAPSVDSPKAMVQQFSVGAQRTFANVVGAVPRLRGHGGPQPRQPRST